MKVKPLNSDKMIWVNIRPYLINWDKPSCSKFQTKVKNFLEPFWINCLVAEEFRIPKSLLRIDFINFNKKIVIEASGEQHEAFTPFFHSNSRLKYLEGIKRDMAKQQWCEQNGFKFVEIYEKDLPLTRKFFKENFDIDLV